jgi:hypothetical protein
MQPLAGVEALPVHAAMPDVLTMNDGTKVTTAGQWQKRREEMKRILEYYAVGQMPPPPGNVTGREIQSQSVLDGKVKYRLVRLTFGPKQKLELNIGIFTPIDQKGPFPAVISQSGTPPGAIALPRLPQGPNQGRGQDVLLLVGPVPTNNAPAAVANTAPLVPGQEPPANAATNRFGRGGFGGPANAEDIAKRNGELFRRGYALAMFNPNGLRLGHSRGVGLGRVAGRRLSRNRPRDRQNQTHHHRRIAQRKILDDRRGLRRAADGRAGRDGRRRHRRVSLCRSAQQRDAGHHDEEISELVFAAPARVLGSARETAVR